MFCPGPPSPRATLSNKGSLLLSAALQVTERRWLGRLAMKHFVLGLVAAVEGVRPRWVCIMSAAAVNNRCEVGSVEMQ